MNILNFNHLVETIQKFYTVYPKILGSITQTFKTNFYHPALSATPPMEGNKYIESHFLNSPPERRIFNYLALPKNKKLTQRSRELRKAGNLAEVLFWQAFKYKKSLGYDIDRQVIIGNFIVDFFIPELGLVFEIDGSSHDFKQEYDAQREAILRGLQLEVIHFTDLEVKKFISSVKEKVVAAIKIREDEINAVASTLKNSAELSSQKNSPLERCPKGGVDSSVFYMLNASTPSVLQPATPQEGNLGGKHE